MGKATIDADGAESNAVDALNAATTKAIEMFESTGNAVEPPDKQCPDCKEKPCVCEDVCPDCEKPSCTCEEHENNIKMLDQYRADNDLKDKGGCIAFASVNGRRELGLSGTLTPDRESSLQKSRDLNQNMCWCYRTPAPRHLGYAQALRHAEANSLLNMCKQLPKVVKIYVELPTCSFCQRQLPYLMKELGVEKLIIYQKSRDDKSPPNPNPYIINRHKMDDSPGFIESNNKGTPCNRTNCTNK